MNIEEQDDGSVIVDMGGAEDVAFEDSDFAKNLAVDIPKSERFQIASDLIELVEKDKKGQIVVDAQNRTSVPGIFAAGDATAVPEKQIAIAVGEGSKAALQLIHYLQTL